MDLIRLSGIGMDFDGRRPLHNVNFTLRRGEFVVLSGPNGAGKTTLLRIMLKLLKPTAGKVEYYDRDGVPVKRIRIGYLPQKSKIDTRFPISVREAVASGMRRGLLGRLPDDAGERLSTAVKDYGLGDFLDQPIGTLSGGQLQRTLLARAVIDRPELLVLDEPLSYVDKNFEEQFYELLRRLSESMTILLVSHELSRLRDLADRTVTISELE